MAYYSDEDPHGGSGSSGSGSGLLGALAYTGASIYSTTQARKNVKDTIEANKEQAEYAYSKDLEMWNRQNQYNSPEAQMARLKSAGLNPNMVYGHGTVAGNTGGQQPKYNAPTIDYSSRPVAIDFPSIIAMYQDFSMRQAQIDNLRANEQNTKARTVVEMFKGTKAEYDESNLHPYIRGRAHAEAQAAEAKMQQEWKRLGMMSKDEQLKELQIRYDEKKLTAIDIDNEKRQAEKLFMDYRNEWMKMGVTSSDNVMLRMVVRMINESGIDIKSLIK